jgi:hypothetical protein
MQLYKIGVAGPMWFRELVDIAGGILTIVACVLVLAAVPLAFALWRMTRQIGESIARAQREVRPLIQDAAAAARDLAAVSTMIRGDAAALHATIADVNERVRAGVRAAERRARELDTLARMAQEEVERVVLSAVAAARGVRAGASILGGRMGARAPGGPAAASRRPAPTGTTRSADGDGEEMVTYDSGEFGDADERWGEAGDGGPRPRIRSRRGGH